MSKNFCITHHLFYTSCNCPMCISEQSETLARRFYKPIKTVKVKENKCNNEITADALLALKAKFNSK